MPLSTLDGTILLLIQEHVRCPALSTFLIPLTNFGEAGVLWILLSLLLLTRRRTRKTGWMALLAMLVCYLFNDEVVKEIIQRPRPFQALSQLSPLIQRPNSYSFPSGHACSSFAAATTYWRGLRGKDLSWLRWLALILALLMAFSRLYVGVHYPTDILCGALVGSTGATLLWLGLSRRYDQIALRLSHKKT